MSTSTAQTNGAQQPEAFDLAKLPKTKLLFHSGAHQQTYEHQTSVASIQPVSALLEADRNVFKAPADSQGPFFVVITKSTIFHPQGGGQPSDVGEININGNINNTILNFKVLAARTGITASGVVLHFGAFDDPNSIPHDNFSSLKATQHVDADKRRLFSRLHTAGHALGAATRTLLESRIENFDELKASHFPDSAACEFQGLIDGKYKPEIQAAVDELVDKDAEVRVGWWTKADFRSRGLDRLLPSDNDWHDIAIVADENGDEIEGSDVDDEKTRIRVVDIVGAEVYPCGGTHVPSTKGCGKVTVRKISRQKGNSRVSYLVD